MTRVVIESPLGAPTRAGIDEHKRYARRAVIDSLARGEAPYAAHLFFDQPELLDDLIPDQRQRGLEAGLIWATQADVCAVYLDRGLSTGMRLGIRQAVTLGMRISFRWLDRCNVWTAGEAAALLGGTPGATAFCWSFPARLPPDVVQGLQQAEAQGRSKAVHSGLSGPVS